MTGSHLHSFSVAAVVVDDAGRALLEVSEFGWMSLDEVSAESSTLCAATK